ncbi:hypothetical protein cypCar_00045938 [Cyprinus carpio]|nr:hypothetical protein cypCar_00045938 [Cyprinus carpio]
MFCALPAAGCEGLFIRESLLSPEKLFDPKPSFDEMSPELTALLQSTRSWSPSASASASLVRITQPPALHKPSESPERHLSEEEDQQPPAEEPLDQPQVPEPPAGPLEPAVYYQACVACVEPLSSVQSLHESESESDDDSSDSGSINSANFSGPLTHAGPARADSHSDSESGGESFSLSTDDDDDDEQSPNMSPSEQRGVAEGHSGEIELTAGLEALAQAIKEAKEQHPDMSVTKVVVHKETEITPEE